MKVTVTAKDIADGRPADSENCPVALALRRVTSHRWDVFERSCWEDVTEAHYRTPAPVRRFITNFDEGRPVAPFTFELAG